MSSTTTPRVVPAQPAVILRILLAIVFAGAGVAKLYGMPAMVSLFASIAAGQWLRFAVGGAELCGALLLITPALAGVGALLLSGVMVGAIVTEVLRTHTSPLVPMVVLALLGFLAWEYRATAASALARVRAVLSR